MSKNALKNKAIRLRKRGKSYGEINKELGIAKSTLSSWLKSIPLSDVQKKRFYTDRIKNLSYGRDSMHSRRQREISAILKHGADEVTKPVSAESFKLFGAAIYWGEGTKKGPLEITNSDPLLILCMVDWIEKFFDVKPEQLKVRLNIYAQQDENDIKNFWSDLCGIPLENFGKAYVKPASKNVKTNNLYYGTVKIVVPKSTDMKYRTFGWIEGVLEPYKDKVKNIQRKWDNLPKVERPVNLE